jgi:hypothetical protein
MIPGKARMKTTPFTMIPEKAKRKTTKGTKDTKGAKKCSEYETIRSGRKTNVRL